MPLLLALKAPSGPVLVFFVLFAVILIGPVIFNRLGLPGLIGLVLGGFIVGAHGLDLIDAGNHTVPELGQLGLLYLMFIAGLELDMQVLSEYRRAAVAFGLMAFAIPLAAGLTVGFALGWSVPAAFLLGSLLSSHTLIVYPTLREAGLAGNPAVASAIGATVLTDTLALVVLAIVAGTQTDSGSLPLLIVEIVIGLAVLLLAALFVLPRLVDLAFRFWGSDRVARYIVVIVALLFMAMLAQIFDIEGIVGAFFAGLALNRLVPNESPSMERVEFFGAAVFVPVFLVSIGLLLDPSVMFTTRTLGLAALLPGRAVARLQPDRDAGHVRADDPAGGRDAGRDADRVRDRPLQHLGRQRRARADPGEHRRLGAARAAGRRPAAGERGAGAGAGQQDPRRDDAGRAFR
jgi:Kef-type K+ transport system membrane component KefB